ncbi:unnamed protein product, partial [Meganyctiphanes norvegica]
LKKSWLWKFDLLSTTRRVIFLGFLVFGHNLAIIFPAVKTRSYVESLVHGSWGITGKRSGRGARLPWCQPLKYRFPPGPSTALVSFPGSGNTWLRYLLQQVTGYFTGSVYKDYALLKNGFPAESVCNGSVIAVKTHEWGPEMRNKFNRAILMLRDPYLSIQAEFNRQSGGHIGHAQPEKYVRNKGMYWEKFVNNKATAWMNTTLDWLKFEGPLHLVFYEDLLDNLPEEMRRILEFLDIEVDDASFDCMLRHQDGIYKRRKRPLSFDPFNAKLRGVVDNSKSIVDQGIREHLAGGDLKLAISSINSSASFVGLNKKLKSRGR